MGRRRLLSLRPAGWMGVLVGGYFFRAPEDASLPWYRLYHTKVQIWMFLFAFLGNYFTEYFYEVLHMQYGFEATWNVEPRPRSCS